MSLSVVKRDGSIVEFDKLKIVNAILKAMKYGDGINTDIAYMIANEIEEMELKTVHTIETTVFHKLIKYGQDETARKYESYRSKREFARQTNSTDHEILTLVNGTNADALEENSNKKADTAATQRDLIAGEVSKDIFRRRIMPTHLLQAHDEGIFHWHDADYSIQSIHNCFSGDTKFVTSNGVKSFNECSDGEELLVVDKDGKWRKATVKQYGKQRLNKITIQSGRTVKTIRATSNHRWILKDGSVTTDLKVNDKLYLLNNIEEVQLNPHAFCIGFILGDGTDVRKNSGTVGVQVRLCGEKMKYKELFLKCGYKESSYKTDNNDVIMYKNGDNFKNRFIESKAWRFMSKDDKISLFKGYYAADGAINANKLCTTDENLMLMIREISALAGYYITSETVEVRNTQWKKDFKITAFRFMKNQPTNRNWVVKDISTEDKHDYNVWCVEEPITKTFTLDGGIVTGNCDLVNLEDMLLNGTVINDKLVESPNSFLTACTVATQIMAQVASSQYGGQSIALKHLAPFIERSYRRYHDMLLNVISEPAELKAAINVLLEKEIRAGIQTIRYQLSTLQTTNGQSPFATIYLEIDEDYGYVSEQAILVKEMLQQRIEGMKNYKGQEIAEAFPKLVYLLDEHNCLEGGKYDYLTELAAECMAKRMVPDLQSAKILRENYEGGTFPPINALVA